jgi:hypothetical protein
MAGRRKCSASPGLHSDYHRVHLATPVREVAELKKVGHSDVVSRYNDLILMFGIVNEPTAPIEPVSSLYVASR